MEDFLKRYKLSMNLWVLVVLIGLSIYYTSITNGFINKVDLLERRVIILENNDIEIRNELSDRFDKLERKLDRIIEKLIP